MYARRQSFWLGMVSGVTTFVVMGFILPMVRDLDGKRRYVHVEKKKLRYFKSGGERCILCALVARPLVRMLLSTATKKRRGWGELVCECVERLHVLSFGMGLWVPVCRAF